MKEKITITMKKLILIILLIAFTAEAKQVEAQIHDSLSYTYIDSNDDAVFDSLIIATNNDTTVIILPSTTVKPNKSDYQNAELIVRLKNYSDTFKDAYFQIQVRLNGKPIGYYEHNYRKKELIYRDSQ